MQNVLETSITRQLAAGGPVSGWYIIKESGPSIFVVEGDLNIIRLDMPFSPSGKWRASAVYERYQNGRMRLLDAPFSIMANRMSDGIPMTFKNGKPLYYLSDIDHGTYRVNGAGILRVSRAVMSIQPDGRWNFHR